MIPNNELHLQNVHHTKSKKIYRIIEIGYIGYLFYSMFSVSLGIAIPNLGAIWLTLLAVLCVPLINWHSVQKNLVLFVVAISGSHILIQLIIYRQYLGNPYIIDYFWWPFLIVIISTLMQQPGFYKRLIIYMVIPALIWSPFVIYQNEAGVTRISLDAGNALDNSNTYAQWFGFCILALWSWSLQKPKPNSVWLIRSIALVSLALALRALSRGFILGVILGFVFSLRKLKLTRTLWIIIIFGVFFLFLTTQIPFFNQIWDMYNIRFSQETSRINVLNLGIAAIKHSPFWGYGIQNLRVILPITPHNEIILLWLTSGIIPVSIYLLFVLYCLITILLE